MNKYALPGAVECVACAVGTEANEEGSSGCTPKAPPPTCNSLDHFAAQPALQDYDCLLDYLHSASPAGPHAWGTGCLALLQAFYYGASRIPCGTGTCFEYMASGVKRICPKSLETIASYVDGDDPSGYYDYYDGELPDHLAKASYAARQLLAEVTANWGYDDDNTLDFHMWQAGVGSTGSTQFILQASDYGAMYKCDDYAEFVFDAAKHCAVPFFAHACPQKCGGHPSPTIMCNEPTNLYPQVGAGQTFQANLDFQSPVRGPDMVNCGPGWKMNDVTRLIEPKCGKPSSMDQCPDELFFTPQPDGVNYEPVCMHQQPVGTKCDPHSSTSCNQGLTCSCHKNSRKLLFGSFGSLNLASDENDCECKGGEGGESGGGEGGGGSSGKQRFKLQLDTYLVYPTHTSGSFELLGGAAHVG